jgi:N-acetylglucosaminyl-diphospho-decaprenol L-rhamnosyltransferase
VRSILADGAASVVVVENGAPGSTEAALSSVLGEASPSPVRIVRPGRNVGYGGGVNRGLAALAADPSPPEWVLVSNADLEVHAGALGALRAALEEHRAWAIVGPRVLTDAGDVYPSVRAFPSFTDAAGHALLALFKPDNPFTRRYNPGAPEGDVVMSADWVSGSCFMARRDALEELGGFDEAYFMYLEDTDLCWRAHHAGWGVGFAGTASVTHVQGVSTARHPYRMMVAHHRSALRFTVRTTTGWRRLALPLAVLVLAVRMAMAAARVALTR